MAFTSSAVRALAARPVVAPIPIPPVPIIPYEDARRFKFDYRTSGIYERGAEFKDVPKIRASPAECQIVKDEMRQANKLKLGFDKRLLPVGVVFSLIDEDYLRIAPRDIQLEIATDKTRKSKENFVQVGKYLGFVPLPETFRKAGVYGIREDGTHVVIVEGKHSHQSRYPVVYLIGRDGFMIACHRSWSKGQRAKELLKNGTGYVLGRRSYWKNRYEVTWFVVTFELVTSTPSDMEYRRAQLSSELCRNQTYGIMVAPLTLTAFKRGRPGSEYVAHHKGNRCDNNVDEVDWITHRDNCLPENCVTNAERNRTESSKTLKKKFKARDAVNWKQHPLYRLKVNAGGTHCFNMDTKRMLSVRVQRYKKRTKRTKKHRVYVTVKYKNVKRDYGRIALETKLGRLLLPEEECDHIDQRRRNNKQSNLRPLHKLGNANNTSMTTKFSEDGAMRCIYFVAKKDHWVAKPRDYTFYDEYEYTCSRSECFSLKNYGESSEDAKLDAIDFLEGKQLANAKYREEKEAERERKVADKLASGELLSIDQQHGVEGVVGESEPVEDLESRLKRGRTERREDEDSDDEYEFDWNPLDDKI